jgi:hypothetical protein
MAREEPEIDYVDYPSIQFPSDRVTLAALHRHYPAEFDEKGPPPLPVDPLVKAVCEKDGRPLPPPGRDWLFDLLRAMPADQTILHLRRAHPDVFDVEGGIMEAPRAHYHSSGDVYDMLLLERGLARIAYQEAFGNPRQVARWVELPERDGYREDLSGIYVKFGLARGQNEARQMIAHFEADAAAQAGPGQQPHRPR